MAIHQQVTAPAAADTAMLALAPADAAAARGSLWSFLFRHELSLEGLTPEEVLGKAGDHQELLRRHGRRRVLEFYEHRLLPALSRFSASVEVWRRRFEVDCRTVALRAAHQPSARVVKLARWLADELPRARFSSDPKQDFATRRQVRAFLAGQLADAGASLEALGQESAALEAYELAQRLEPMNPELREKLAPFLWRTGDRSPRAVAAYVRHLRDCGQNGAHPGLSAMQAFVGEKIRITEDSHPDELPQRIQWNQLALLGAEPLTGASDRTGLGYLGLDQPERSIPYLSHARSGDGAGAERASAFFHLGQVLYLNGAFAEAMTAFGQAEKAGYSTSRIIAWLALALAISGHWKAARQLFEDAEQMLSREVDGEFYVQWGRTSFLCKDPEDAERRFERALDHDALDGRALHGRAICMEQQGHYKEAIELLKPIIERCERFAPLLHRFGRLLEKDGRPDDALRWYRQAAERSPNDPHYALALGLVLDDQGSAETLPYLTQGAEAEVGGPEVLRRLVLGHRRNDNRRLCRHWLKIWASGPSGSQEVARFYARELASQATEAFNAGRWAEAATLARRIAPELPNHPQVQEWLGCTLLFDAVSRLGNGSGDGVWNQIDEAHQLCATTESRFYHGVSLLIRGDDAGAAGQLRALAKEFPERRENGLFAELAAACSGDQRAAESLASLEDETEASHLASLLFILQLHQAVSRKDFARAAELMKAWLQDSGRAREIDLPPHQINILAAVCLVRGTKKRRRHVVRIFEQLNAQGDGGWDLSLLVARHLLATGGGLAQGEDPGLLAELDAGYRKLLHEATTPEEQRAIRQTHAELLRFTVADHFRRQNVIAARETLAELRNLPLPMPPALAALEKALDQKMTEPSHEKAFALRDTAPETAREVWSTLLERDPNDLVALHHLACLAWTRAYDEFAAGNFDHSCSFWKEGLNKYGRLYSRDDFWKEQQVKGRALQDAKNRFDEAAFTAWRRDVLYQLAYSVLDLVFHLLAGKAPTANHDVATDSVLQAARNLMKTLRESDLEPDVVERLSFELARHYLDRDPTNLSDYDAAVKRARWVIDIDPENVSARCFLIRAATHRVGTQREQGEGKAAEYAACLEQQAEHAAWLTRALADLKGDWKTRLTSDLAAYHDEMGMIKHQEGLGEIDRFNAAAHRFDRSERRTLLKRVRLCFRGSDVAFKRSLGFQSTNLYAERIMDAHREAYQQIEEALE